MVVANQGDIMAHGCPVGSLCSELAKAEHPHLDDAGTVSDPFVEHGVVTPTVIEILLSRVATDLQRALRS